MSQSSPDPIFEKIKWSEIKVLITEDDDDLREIMCTFFESHGCQVYSASNGVEAFELLKKEKGIHLVVSDVRMPVGDGIDLVKNIRKHFSTLPIVFLVTGYADLSQEDAIKFGATALIHKPYSIMELFRQIESELIRTHALDK